MIQHCVFLSLHSPLQMRPVEEAMELLSGLVDEIDGMVELSWGPNMDYEGKSPDYHFGFVAVFEDRDAHLAYEEHPVHVRAGSMLIAACKGGYEGIFVADLETE
ncbi:Dabb family protein [Oricola nitratireducens]|uniref:Dabb family protein n=1 Tax=Oricola nitratireducens TaxID=2775868 RepID=UPI0018693D1D|nr:Dabb family protein [Oricola nitratireducens]